MRFLAGPCSRFVERDHELASLSQAAAAAAADGSRLIVITGEAGVGKSRLCREFTDALGGGWAVLQLGGYRTDRRPGVPFEPFVESVPAEEEPARAVGRAVAAALRRHAGERPVALVVEDLHSLDPIAALALPHAVDALGSAPVLLVATFRLGSHPLGSPHSRTVAHAVRHHRAAELRLSPLTTDGVGEMVRAMRGAERPDLAIAVHDRTGGNPFFVEELLRSPGTDVPWTVAEAVLVRVDALDERARRAADLLAVAGEPLPVRVLVELAGDRAAEVLVDAALAVVLPDERVGLRHALVGEALLTRPLTATRAELHRSLAVALEAESPPSPGRLARHWSEAGDRRRAAAWATIAADHASGRRAYHTATDLYELALEHPPGNAAERAALFQRAAGAAAVVGERTDALGWAEEARRSYHDAGQRWRAAGRWVNPALLKLVDEPPGDDSRATAAVLLAAQTACTGGDYEQASDLARQAMGRASVERDTTLCATAALALVYAGDFSGGCEALTDLAERARSASDEDVAVRVLGHLARAAWVVGDVDQAIRFQREALACIRPAGDPSMWGHAQGGLAFILAGAGELREAEALAQELLVLGSPLMTGMAEAVLTVVDMERGDMARARERLAVLLPAVRAMGVDLFKVVVFAAGARLELLAGDFEAALAAVAEGDSVLGAAFHESRSDLLLVGARAALALGAAEELHLAAATAADLARHAGGVGIRAAADAIAGLAARATGRGKEAAASFRSAAEAWERTPRWALAGEAWCDVAEAVGPASERIRARERALAIARARGLKPVVTRAAALDGSVGRGASDNDPAVASLTAREADIVRMVAAGRSNREVADTLFLSEKTVRNNLSRAFTKLGVARRTELAPLLMRDHSGP